MALLSERDIAERIRRGELRLPRCSLFLARVAVVRAGAGDLELVAQYQNRKQPYLVECKAGSTPRLVQSAALHIAAAAKKLGLRPLLVVPYLSEERLDSLEREGVSAVDLNGNGVLIADAFFVRRTGQPNRFPEGKPIRSVYKGSSALFTRCFLLRPEFASLTAFQEFACSQAGGHVDWGLVIGTAFKVVNALEEELAVSRAGRHIRVLDADRLLAGLLQEFRPSEGRRLVGKTALHADEVWRRLDQQGVRAVATGLGQQPDMACFPVWRSSSLYVRDVESVAELLQAKESSVFPNIELVEERAEPFYFDARNDGYEVWASPVQTGWRWRAPGRVSGRRRGSCRPLYGRVGERRSRLSDPLHGHLVDILSHPASGYLILAGGYGILLKLRYLRNAGVRTLVADLPDPRATQDLDFFVRLEMFVQKEEGGRYVRFLIGLDTLRQARSGSLRSIRLTPR